MTRKRVGVDAGESGRSAHDTHKSFVRVLGKGLDVLRCFRAGDTFLGNGEIAERLGLPKQTVSRLTYTLVCLGYLGYSETRAKYRLATGVLALAYPMLTGLIIRQSLRPLMAELAAETGGSVSLGTRHQDRMIYLESFNSPASRNHVAELGSMIPIYDSAMGKAYLAVSPPAERSDVLSRLASGPAEARELEIGIRQAADDLRERGFCLSSGVAHHRIAVATPLSHAVDGARLVVNCGLPRTPDSVRRMDADIGPRLAALIRRFEATVGLQDPDDDARQMPCSP